MNGISWVDESKKHYHYRQLKEEDEIHYEAGKAEILLYEEGEVQAKKIRFDDSSQAKSAWNEFLVRSREWFTFDFGEYQLDGDDFGG